MPTEAALGNPPRTRHPVAARRILRLAFGTALCLLITQFINSPLMFIAPVLTMFILALPAPAPGLKKGVIFVIAMLLPMALGTLLLPVLQYARWAGIGLVAIALFYSFYYTARGGSPVLGTFMTVGLTVVVTVGSVSAEVLIMLIKGLGLCAALAMIFVWIAHALLPDLPTGARAAAAPAPAASPPPEAARQALRSLLIVLPLALLFLFMSGSPAYTVVMIKVATLGQQASADKSADMGRELIFSTLLGGLGAIAAWCILGIWHALPLYALLVALAGLLYGRWIFQGLAVHPRFSMASYAFLTMLVVLGPTLATGSGDAAGAFWTRLGLFLLIACYGTAAVAVFDAFFPRRR